MEAHNRCAQALKAGKKSFGAWQGLPGTNHARILARTPGLDWVTVDCEHGQLSDDSMHEAVAAIAACGVSPLVRVQEGQHWMIKRALDAGAHGIIVPLVQSAEQAKDIVKFSKFPPLGNRGLGSALPMEKWITGKTGEVAELSMADYYRDSNKSHLTIIQIESQGALEDVEKIAAVEGVDVLFVGPNDLGNSIGYPMVLNGGVEAPELKEAIERVKKAAKDNGKKVAMYSGDGKAARQYAEEGFDMVSVINDILLIKQYAAEHSAAANGVDSSWQKSY